MYLCTVAGDGRTSSRACKGERGFFKEIKNSL